MYNSKNLPSTKIAQILFERAQKVIPGGTSLFGKRPSLYLPGKWPTYYRKAKGCRVWDIDGNSYFDFTMVGIGTSVLGYGDPHVRKKVKQILQSCSFTSLNSPHEVLLAEKLIELHPWSHQVRFTRSGGETCAVAARIVRAFTNKTKIAVCGYHGWHDWYLSVNLDGKVVLIPPLT